MDRRLSAIMAADISGYSRLIGEDEEGTIRAVQEHQAALVPLIQEHGGQIIDTAGDSILAEFGSVVSAVRAAADAQRLMGSRNADVPKARRVEFRIGINQGEIVCDQDRFYGDGINVASRLRALAEPGGIAISGRVHEDVAGKLDLSCRMGGDVSGSIAALVPGPGHSRIDRSLSIKIDPQAPDGFVVNSFAYDDPIQCRAMGLPSWRPHLGRGLSFGEGLAQPRGAREDLPRHDPRQDGGDTDADRQCMLQAAMQIWHESHPAGGTPVEIYLQSRGLYLPNIVAYGGALRFHPLCPFGKSETRSIRAPAMVCLMTDPATGEPRAIHRTALKADGSGKADGLNLGNPKKMLGAARGAVVRLCHDAEVTHGLGLAAAICAGFEPVWAAASAGNMQAFPVLSGIESLTLFADAGKAGETAVQECGRRWADCDREVVARFPTGDGDWNDLIGRRHG
jgi:hypothetical protein